MSDIPYHYCRKCGDQLPASDWGLGLCVACAYNAPELSKKHYDSVLEQMVEAEDTEMKITEIREARLKILRAEQHKKETIGSEIPTGFFGEKDSLEKIRKGQPNRKRKPRPRVKGSGGVDLPDHERMGRIAKVRRRNKKWPSS